MAPIKTLPRATSPARTAKHDAAAPVGTLERGLSILQFFKAAPEAPISEVADAVGLSRSTTYRIAERLRELGFLEVNAATGRWRLGREAVQLGVVALQSTDVMQVAPELLRVLLEMAGEAVNLAVFDADSMVLLYREQGPQSVTISSRLGTHRPMHASSLGKAFLAAMQESERRVLLGRIALKRYTERDDHQRRPRWTGRSPTSAPAAMPSTAASSRRRSPAAAAAVFDHRRLPVAAISVSGPAERVSPQLDRIGGLVADTARAISARLGFVAR